MLKDKPLRLRRRLVTIAACLLALTAMWGIARWPSVLENVYAQGFGFYLARTLSLVTGIVRASLAEWTLGLLIVSVLAAIVIAVAQLIRRQRSAVNVISNGLLRIVTIAAVVVAGFYLLWGLNYARAPLQTRLGWKPIERPADAAESERQTEEIALLTQQLIEAANRSYQEFAGTDDLGRPSQPPAGATSIDATIDAAFVRVQERLLLEPGFGAARGRAKPLSASVILNYLQLSGFYFPWTAEANYNRLVPPPTLAHVIAHEKSHQRGIAREDEANFLGYLACAMSDDPYTRYSGYLFAQQQLLGELVRRDLNRAREIAALRAKGMLRDIEAINLFWAQYEGRAAELSESMNNRYLRSQGERRGVAAYAASRNLIVLFARNNDGKATGR
jgi:hypothetical protein